MRRTVWTVAAALAVLAAGPAAPAGTLDELDRELTALAARVSKSVVTVTSEAAVVLKPGDLPGWPLHQVLGPRTTASGIVYDAAGHIVTVAGSVPPGRRVKVRLPDGRTVTAQVKGRDSASNLAVLKVDVAGLVPAAWGSAGAVKPGSVVLAVGSSFGMGPSVTLGVVSAVGRCVGGHADLIQITAPVNPGDSGGLLVNGRGEVAGIITATLGRAPSGEWLSDFFERWKPGRHGLRDIIPGSTPDRQPAASGVEVGPRYDPVTGEWYIVNEDPGSVIQLSRVHVGSQGMNYALPADTVKAVVDQLIKHGKVSRGWLGVMMEARTDGRPGLVVADVVKDSPAAKAGIKKGDRLLTVAGVKMNRFAQLSREIARKPPGTKVTVEVRRGDETLTLTATLADRPGTVEAPTGDVEVIPVFGPPRLGIQFQPLSGDLAKHFGVPDGRGVLVAAVEPGSPAAKGGVKVGDCLVAVEKEPVADGSALRALLRKHAGKSVTLDLIRDRKPISVTVNLPAATGLRRRLDETEKGFRELLKKYRSKPELEGLLRKLEKDLEALREKLRGGE